MFPFIANTDFDATAQNATLRAGETEVCVNISIVDDGTPEGDEEFCVEVTSPVPQVSGDPNGCDVCVTITDPPTPSG